MCLFHKIERGRYDDDRHELTPFALNIMEVLMVHPVSRETLYYHDEDFSRIELKDGTKIEVIESMMEVLQAMRACSDMASGN